MAQWIHTMCVPCVISPLPEMTTSRDTWRASMDRIRSRDIHAVSVEKVLVEKTLWGDTSSLAKQSASSVPGVTVWWKTLLRWSNTWDYARYPHVVCVRSSLSTWISWESIKNLTGNEKPLPTPSLINSKSKNLTGGSIVVSVWTPLLAEKNCFITDLTIWMIPEPINPWHLISISKTRSWTPCWVTMPNSFLATIVSVRRVLISISHSTFPWNVTGGSMNFIRPSIWWLASITMKASICRWALFWKIETPATIDFSCLMPIMTFSRNPCVLSTQLVGENYIHNWTRKPWKPMSLIAEKIQSGSLSWSWMLSFTFTIWVFQWGQVYSQAMPPITEVSWG